MGVEAHTDRIESELRRPDAVQPPGSQPLARHRPDLPPLANADRGERAEDLAGREPNDPGPDLAAHEKALVARDHVELPVPTAEIPLDHPEPTRLEMPGGQLLAERAQPAPRVGHRATRSQPPSSRRTRWPSASSRPS